MELSHVVGAPDPHVLKDGGKAVAAMRVAGTNHKDVARDGLQQQQR